MKTFNDLIEQGVAPTKVTNWGSTTPNTPVTDKISKFIVDYNRCFGICNNTHMDRNPYGLCITGSEVANTQAFDVFLHAKSFRNVVFPCITNEFFKIYGYKGEYSVQNGQLIYQLTPIN